MKRIELPTQYEDFDKTLLTGDLLFIKSNKGVVSHVVLWVGKIGNSRDGVPLIIHPRSGARSARFAHSPAAR